MEWCIECDEYVYVHKYNFMLNKCRACVFADGLRMCGDCGDYFSYDNVKNGYCDWCNGKYEKWVKKNRSDTCVRGYDDCETCV